MKEPCQSKKSLFVVPLAEMPNISVALLKKVFVIWWNSKELGNK
jgi:hypothetical protein